ncbi:methyltransferase family protein [Paraburkholderia sp. GV068]|uniref:class I SAM-dependent methyltransferase n=1 Tax=Paraburkholderia TaxID=1822464 RepID=UPI000D31A60B|nr:MULTISPECIES: class I SAM-dependent methyltransferase [Paraburkholderia]AXF07806.1 SAM-dependent methyltransferase [Paraburkholderia graminis]MDR6466559.1 SAM-dependent methyltransferase [Paraburkholderia graminis]MDR6474165.1 SAM-dependent methyltransferase [Paraburkholderia graminis]PTR00302.1 methyltransferase family protein [Paraburkholderia sp. GV072]PUB05150.1 methyltransferase family protein [Paraburkholderia sp. GV068]
MNSQSELDRINRLAWNSRDAARVFTTGKSFSDAGEEAAFRWLAPRCSGTPLLDIGIGTGRTVALMLSISNEYTGVDYAPNLLETARSRYPGCDLRHMDARDMSELPSDHYGLAAFSWNGIDCVDYNDRVKILQEMYRVVRPGGYVLFSSHNRGGPGYREGIWHLLPRFTLNPLTLGWRTLRSMRRFQLGTLNYIHNVKLNRDYGGYAVKTAAAHNFGIVIVYTTLAEQRRQLAQIGLQCDAVFDSCAGNRISDGVENSGACWFHFIAHKPLAAHRLDDERGHACSRVSN